MEPLPVVEKTSGLNVGSDEATIDNDPQTGIVQLQVAVDVDITDKNYVELTKGGYTQLYAGSYHSLWRDKFDTFVGLGTNLYRVNNDKTTTLLKSNMSGDWIYYCQVGQETFFSDNTNHGIILSGEILPWKVSSRSVTPSLRVMLATIAATHLCFKAGRIYFVVENCLFWTELNLFGLFSPAHSNIVFEDNIKVVENIEAGLIISTDKATWLLSGRDPYKYQQSMTPIGPPIHERSVALQRRSGIDIGLSSPGECIFFTTDYGAGVITPSGEMIIVNKNTVMYPTARKGASVIHGNQLRQVLRDF